MPSFSKKIAETIVINYIPQQIEETRAPRLDSFVKQQTVNSALNFEINPVVSQQIGLADAKEANYKKLFEQEVFKYVQKIKDGAYKEAFDMGLADGIAKAKEQALEDAKGVISERLTSLSRVEEELLQLRAQMYEENKADLISLCYFLVERIVYKAIETDPSYISRAINDLINAQDLKEHITIHLSSKDFKFIQEHLLELNKEIDRNNCIWEEDNKLNPGDILVKNSKGTIDAKINTRLDKLKSILEDFI